MLNAYKTFWKKYADFSSRTTRSEWWWCFLCNFIIWIVLGLILGLSTFGIVPSSDGETINAIWIILYSIGFLLVVAFFFATLVPGLAMDVRRLRDAGFHWAMIFLACIPVVGSFVLFVLLQMPTKDTDNN